MVVVGAFVDWLLSKRLGAPGVGDTVVGDTSPGDAVTQLSESYGSDSNCIPTFSNDVGSKDLK